MFPNGGPIPAGPVPLLGQPHPEVDAVASILGLFGLEVGGPVWLRTVRGAVYVGEDVTAVVTPGPGGITIVGVRFLVTSAGRLVTVMWGQIEALGLSVDSPAVP